MHNVPAYAYVESQFRRFQVTGEKECRGKEEAKHMAQTYLCLLKSVRLQEVMHKKIFWKLVPKAPGSDLIVLTTCIQEYCVKFLISKKL